MANELHNPFRPGDFVALDRPAKARFEKAPDGSDEWNEMFWTTGPFKAWREIAGVSRQVNTANLKKMIDAGLIETFNAEWGRDPAEALDDEIELEIQRDFFHDGFFSLTLGNPEIHPVKLEMRRDDEGSVVTMLLGEGEVLSHRGDCQDHTLELGIHSVELLASDLAEFARAARAKQRELTTR